MRGAARHDRCSGIALRSIRATTLTHSGLFLIPPRLRGGWPVAQRRVGWGAQGHGGAWGFPHPTLRRAAPPPRSAGEGWSKTTRAARNYSD
jgi:hypothetical protein